MAVEALTADLAKNTTSRAILATAAALGVAAAAF